MSEQQNTQQPVARISLHRVDGVPRATLLQTLGGAAVLPIGEIDVYAAPVAAANDPVPRDVLVLLSRWEAFGKAMLKAGSILPRNLVADTESALADRYASQVQTEQPYAADAAMEGMKRLGYRWENGAWYKKGDTQPEPSLTDRQIKHMLALETALSKLIDKVAPGLLLDGDILAEAEEALRIADARNPVVTSGYLCVDCGALFSAADHSQAQPEPVNQQTLAALKRLLNKAYKQNWQDNYPVEVECAEAAIAAAEAAQPVADATTLLRELEWSGSYFNGHGYAVACCPVCQRDQSDGHRDDCKLASALVAQPVAVPDGYVLVPVAKLRALKSSINGDCYKGESWECETINMMLSAAQKPEGV